MSTVIVAIWLLWMSLLDIRSRTIPLWLAVGGGILVWLIFWEKFLPGGMIPGVCLLALAVVTKTVGWGDGVVLSFLGAVLGFQKSLLVLCVGLFFAALSSVLLLLMKKANRNSRLPFLPFLSTGWLLVGIG